MAGIVSYGGYVPRYRIDRKLIYKAMGWLNPATYMPGEKAVANYDEDSLSMAVAAGVDCLTEVDKAEIDAVFFASATPPYAERQSAEIIATALDCRSDIRTADLTDTLKSGTTAILSAADAVDAGSAKEVLVCTGDMRIGKAGSAQEEIFGDGAAAILVGRKDVIAKLIGSFSVSYDFVDHWRGTGVLFDQQWEDRFIRDEGYTRFIVEAMKGLEKKLSVHANEIAHVVYPCLYAGDYRKIAGKLGLSESQLVMPLAGQVGYAGTADPLMHLVKALEEAGPGDRIAVVGYGTGADAILFEVTEKIEGIRGRRRGIGKHLAARRELRSYEKIVAFRDLLSTEKGIRGEIVARTAISELWRNRKQVLGLYGSKCTSCGTPQYPIQRVCVNPDCGAIDEMEPYCFAGRKGSLFTYTGDNLAYSPNPPAIYGFVDFEGGGRYWFDLTDVDLEELETDMEVEMSFRKKYVDEQFGIHGYFWKAIPVMG